MYENEKAIQVPSIVRMMMGVLLKNHFQCYLVGGCVRDFLLGRESKDWDLCTDAKAEEIVRCYQEDDGEDCRFTIIPTGLKHGTVTVRCDYSSGNGECGATTVEITTYRGERHGEGKTLEEDVLHRDFTLNAIAYGIGEGERGEKSRFIDLTNGMEDIKNKVIRAVGKPDERFLEDPLRILRAIRFAANLEGFTIEAETKKAMMMNRELLKNVSPERIQSELVRILQGDFYDLLLEFQEIVGIIIPEMKPCFGFDQCNPYHNFDVYTRATCSATIAA